ncbi:MAG: hypothetical protein L6406_16065 [Desulfobacterales bacterium]|nr:hypothetical protein [Pseudomonadota bacterium]MCG2777186.1 hypothetical protein [Desulfobacterales bacterium]
MGNSEPSFRIRDNGGRRLGGDRRRFSYSVHIPERRPGSDRRSGLDRREGLDRRSFVDQRSCMDRRCGEFGPGDLEMRSGKDRRNGTERRCGIERRLGFA